IAWAPFRDGFVLVAFRDGTTALQSSAVLITESVVDIKHVGRRAHLVHVRPGHVLDAINRLKHHKEVLYVEPDFIHTLAGGVLPNDTFVGSQWAVSNTGQIINGTAGTFGADERSAAAWSVTTGTN